MQSRHRTSSVRRWLKFIFLCSLACSLWLANVPLTFWQGRVGEVVSSQTPDVAQLMQQSMKLYETGDFRGAIEGWQKALTFYKKNNNGANAAIVIEKLARAYQQMGESEQAIGYWEVAIAYYYQIKNLPLLGQMLTQQAQAYNSLGQPKKAIALLDRALQIARTYKESDLEAAALGNRGEAYRLEGDYKQAIADLQNSLKAADKVNNSVERASALNNLGNAYMSMALMNYRRANSAIEVGDNEEAYILRKQALSDDLQALAYFHKSLKIARQRSDKVSEMRFLLNSIPSANRTHFHLAKTKWKEAFALLNRLENLPDKVYAAIELAKFVRLPVDETKHDTQCPKPSLGSFRQWEMQFQGESKALDLLNQAVAIARGLQDTRALSFALGNLGHIYECRQDYDSAINLTRQAQWAAEQNLNDRDSLYLWEWQAGRILSEQNKAVEAINAYERAVATLQNIGSDILSANLNLQLKCRDAIEAIYRELAALRLEQISVTSDEHQENLSAVLKTIDSLKLAELQNYFGDDCELTSINSQSVDLLDTQTATAVFSSIIFKDRTVILLSLPNGKKKYGSINIDSEILRQKINKFRIGLENRGNPTYDPQQAQQLYDWIVRPFAFDLKAWQIKTLVFIQDGILRSVPMAALHDGEKFLVQSYAIATTPSLNLTDLETVNREKLSALAVGLTKDAIVDGRKYEALSNVGAEISQVRAEIPGSKQLLNENFTRARLRQELLHNVYPIIHIATHGEFGTLPEDTFLVTGDNDKLSITDLEMLILMIDSQTASVELLTLTACHTAIGDDRAALGLAGVAVQAGVKSALASLWAIDDAATVTFVTKFYEYWYHGGVSKAEALRAAQQELISFGGQYAHPFYWAPYILVGNWL